MSQSHNSLCVCVCVFPSLFLSVHEPIIIPLVLHLPYAWLPSNLLCTVCQGDTPHTQTHTLPQSVYRFLFFWGVLHPRPPPPLAFTSHVSSLFSLSFPALLCSVPAYSLAFLPSPLYLPLSHWKKKKKKNILSPSGKKSGCIRVMRKFKSLKEDCTVACTKLIFSQCERVCSCVHVSVCGVFCLYACINTFSFEECVSIFAFMCFALVSQLFHFFFFLFLSMSLLTGKSQL